jgi:lipopolysaccharide/colanic/teichoic acid biosynthesis glycosyltransferase
VSRVTIHVHVGAARAAAAEGASVDALVAAVESSRWRKAFYRAGKRALDLAGSLALLAILAPLFALIALSIKLLSQGPVFFRQERVGEGMKPFGMLKFRTMYVGSDAGIHKEFVSSFIKSGALAQEAGRNGMFKIAHDPRVTPIGRILRKTSLDELPQLWNVVRGEMLLVGPRPALEYEVNDYEGWHRRRVLDAKPGITGLWQVKGRSRTTFDEMVRLDLRYARGSSLWTDVKILLATPAAVIAGKGAA